MLSTRPINLDNAHVEFEIQLEERLKTVLNSNLEECQDDESKPKTRLRMGIAYRLFDMYRYRYRYRLYRYNRYVILEISV